MGQGGRDHPPQWRSARVKPRVIWMSTSNLETAVETLLNAGAFARMADAEAQAKERFEQLFRITVEPQ